MLNRFPIKVLFLFIILAGCQSVEFPYVYKIDIPQGNIVTQDKVKQLKKGMTKDEVVFLLGSPMLLDAFHNNRWDYYYAFTSANREHFTHHVTLFFTADKLHKIDVSGPLLADEATGVARHKINN